MFHRMFRFYPQIKNLNWGKKQSRENHQEYRQGSLKGILKGLAEFHRELGLLHSLSPTRICPQPSGHPRDGACQRVRSWAAHDGCSAELDFPWHAAMPGHGVEQCPALNPAGKHQPPEKTQPVTTKVLLLGSRFQTPSLNSGVCRDGRFWKRCLEAGAAL